MRLIIVLIISLFLYGCDHLNTKPVSKPVPKPAPVVPAAPVKPTISTPVTPQPEQKKPPVKPAQVPVVAKQAAPTIPTPSMEPTPPPSVFTTIFKGVEYYYDPTITAVDGEFVIALYIIDEDKNRVYKYIPKKDIVEPLTLIKH